MFEDAPDVNPRVANAIRLIDAARQYTQQLIADVDDADWFRIPTGCVSHVAWQVGHLAMAEYGLTMIRLRGKLPEDAAFIDNAFLRTFKKTSTPAPDASLYPSPTDIRACLDAVHAQALRELPTYDDAQLDESLPEPFLGYPTKLGSLHFCHAHEMLHAGQIGMIRRMLGKQPLR
jgi:hypothetical protein